MMLVTKVSVEELGKEGRRELERVGWIASLPLATTLNCMNYYAPFPTLPQPPPPPLASLKRTRSSSPGLLSKVRSHRILSLMSADVSFSQKRVPSTYTPSIYTQFPPHLTWDLPAGLNCASGSAASSPGDWVTRTEDLQLATPPGGSSPQRSFEYGWTQTRGSAAGAMEEDVGMDASPEEVRLTRNQSRDTRFFF